MADHAFTFGDSLNLLSVLLGDSNTSDDDMFPLAIRKTYLNRGELHFSKDSRCMRGYVAGTIASQKITLPSNWVKTFVLVVNNQKADHLEMALQDYERYLNSGDYHWYMWEESGSKVLNFVSSAVEGLGYKLWYFKKPTIQLDLTTATSDIPIEYREASAYWAAWQLLQQIGKTDLANQAMRVYNSFVNQAIAEIKEEYMDRPNPNVDTGDEASSQSSVDTQGKGYTY